MEGAAALHLSASLTFWVTYFLSDDDWAAPDGRDFTWRNIFLKWCTTTSLLILPLQYCFWHNWLLSLTACQRVKPDCRRRVEEISHLSLVCSWQTVYGMFSPQTWTRRTRQDKVWTTDNPTKRLIETRLLLCKPAHKSLFWYVCFKHFAYSEVSTSAVGRRVSTMAAATYGCRLTFYKHSRRYRIKWKIIQRWY